MKTYIIIFKVFFLFCYCMPLHAKEFKELWKNADIHSNAEGNYLKFSGRLHIDSAWFDATQGQYSDLSWRRFRFGLSGQYKNINTVLEADFNLNNDMKEIYNRITDAKISWQAYRRFQLSVLKQSAGFTLDGKTSSKKLYTPQRNNLTNNLWFTAEYFTGISGSGKLPSGLNYHAGLYSSDDSNELGISNGGYFTLLSIGEQWKLGSIRLDYVHNDLKADSNTRNFEEVISISGKLHINAWHIWTDMAYGQGGLGQSDVNAWVLMPFYEQHKNLQWVVRYTWLDSDADNGLRLGRYENEIVDGLGDAYQEIYAGLNWMLNAHKCKLQLGSQYTEMKDNANDGGKYTGWGTTLAFRSYW